MATHAARSRLSALAVFSAAFGTMACSTANAQTTDVPDRGFWMGFTPFPYDISLDAIIEGAALIQQNADLFCMHNDHGVPWDEALAGDPDGYPNSIKEEIARVASSTPAGHFLYVSTTPQRNSRDEQLALYWGESTNQPLPPDWAARNMDDPLVVEAYTNWCSYLISELQPDAFAYAIEANGGFSGLTDPGYAEFRALIAQVYPELKQRHPGVTILLSVQTTSQAAGRTELLPLTEDLLAFSDWIGVSTYPYLRLDADSPPFGIATASNVAEVPADLISRIRDLDPAKPFAITETGFHAERLTIPALGIDLPGTPVSQAAYVEWVTDEVARLGGEFLVWFLGRDHDALNAQVFPNGGEDPLFLIWRDTGLVSGDGRARLGLESWRAVLGNAPPSVGGWAPPFASADFFDVMSYLRAFDAQDPVADIAAPAGVLDSADSAAIVGSVPGP
ncbi:MAG: hypothetical protein AAGB51_03785 [Planctomycetota bacterium]